MMNELHPNLTNPELRTRLMDLSFSLYENLSDFLSDLVVIDGGYSDTEEVAKAVDRMNVAAMDCLGDIHLLAPMLVAIRQHVNPSDL